MAGGSTFGSTVYGTSPLNGDDDTTRPRVGPWVKQSEDFIDWLMTEKEKEK